MTAVLTTTACSSSHRPSGAPPTSTAVAPVTTTTEPGPQYVPSPYVWDRATQPAVTVGGGRTATLSAVLAPQLAGSWLVFGQRSGPDGRPTSTVWSSSDGSTWSAADLSSPGTDGQALAAAEYRAATVAVGSTGDGAGLQATAWLATTVGGAFTPQSVPPSNGPSTMDQVTAGPLGLFATGTVDGRFALWGSTTGHVWSELPGAEKVITSSAGAQVNALMSEGDFVYAAGSIQSGSTTEAALWSTANGLDWHLVGSAATSFTGAGGRVIYSLAPLESGLVAVGAINTGSGWMPASWISPDGQSWSPPSTDFPDAVHPPPSAATLGPSGGSAARSVSPVTTFAGDTSVVAAGGGPYGQGAWQSSDGLHWTSLDLPAAAADATSWRAEAAAATVADTVVMDSEPGQPYLLTYHQPGARGATSTGVGGWTQPSSNPAVFGPVRSEAEPVALRSVSGQLELTVDLVQRPQTIGAARVNPEILASSDGIAWSVAHAATGAPPTTPAYGALIAHLPTGWVAVVSPTTGAPEVFTSPTGSAWRPTARLVPGGGATVNGVCAGRLPSTGALPARYVVAAVGSDALTVATAGASGSDGSDGAAGTPTLAVTTRSAAAWSSVSGATWRAATVNGAPPSGGTQTMSGCLQAGAALFAYGSATSPSGAAEPALWRSADGATWTRVTVGAFAPATAGPLVSAAQSDGFWLAAANPDPQADPSLAGVAGWPGPATGAGTDAGVGPPASLENGRSGLWLSPTGDSSWQLIDTSAAPWLGDDLAQIDLVGFVPGGGDATATVHATSPTTGSSLPGTATPPVAPTTPVPVVVGTVDGQLAVWTGAAAPVP